MNREHKFFLTGLFSMLVLFLADQITKYLAKTLLAGTNGISVIPGVFELYYLENRGAAFGMLANRQIFFVVIAVIMILLGVYVYRKLPPDKYYRPLRMICVLITAGAAGNMTDRLLWNYVIDFLYVSAIDFPIFNVADCYVCIGAAAAVLLVFTLYREESFECLSPRFRKQ